MFNIDPINISGFKFNKTGKISKTSLQNLLKQEDTKFGFVEMKLFGTDHVYSLVNFSKVKNFNISSLINDIYLNNDNYHLAENDKIVPFHIARVFENTPIQKDVNFKCNVIDLDSVNEYDWIMLWQLKNIIAGIDAYSTYEKEVDIDYFIGFGNNIYDDNCKFDLEKLDLQYKDKEYQFHKYKYILVYENDDFEFCNEIYNDNFKGVFVYIDGLNCWQYLSNKKYRNLKSFSRIEIRYATTDSPRCFNNVGYHQEYIFDYIENVLFGAIYIPLDIQFSKIFEYNDILIGPSDKRYDALEISVINKEYQTTVLLTHEELGIDQNNHVKYMDKFCLLKLINKIILLKPY